MQFDLTGVACAVIGGAATISSVLLPMVISKHMADKQAATTLSNAIGNSLGKLAEASTGLVTSAGLTVNIPGVPRKLAAPVKYVTDHAGPEMERLGVTPAAVADKIDARIGLRNLEAAAAAAVAAAAAPAPTPPA